jgi:hypothetical protein
MLSLQLLYIRKVRYKTLHNRTCNEMPTLGLYVECTLFGEGPRSRCYRRTAALRLIVQPCDQDEEKDPFFYLSV